ncbi:MAG: hypothetical protein HQ525_12825 [Anaerolineae bacterium]|nr:hypothetical protein [Anaerolineae bacterium]
MDNSFFQQQEADTHQKRGLSPSRWIFDSILTLIRHSLNWLAGLFKFTEEELEEAGVYLDRSRDE